MKRVLVTDDEIPVIEGISLYLIEFRIEKAKELLSKPGASIKQVSISCGYSGSAVNSDS